MSFHQGNRKRSRLARSRGCDGHDVLDAEASEGIAAPGLPLSTPMQPQGKKAFIFCTQFAAESMPRVELTKRANLFLDWFKELSHCAHCSLCPRNYDERKLVATGSMSSIYSLRDRRLNRSLAMKVAHVRVVQDMAEMSTDELRCLCRFLQEAQIHAQLEHPGVVPLYDLGIDKEGHPFFTMRFVEGVTFETIIKSLHGGGDRWTQRSALRALVQACKPLAYAHSRGVVHRDIKPSNLMVGPFGEVLVMDWGLACAGGPRFQQLPGVCGCVCKSVEDSPNLYHTPRGTVLGTPMYMAPEQACAQPSGRAADIYSLGASLYYLLSGRQCYDDTVPLQTSAVLQELMDHCPRPIETIRPELQPELVAICRRAMERDVSQRYPDVLALSDDLTSYLEQERIAASRPALASSIRTWLRRRSTSIFTSMRW